MSQSRTDQVEGPLAEFSAVRAEILQALQMEWNSFALQLTATAVIFSFSLSNHSRTGFLLIIPVVSYVLGSAYLRYFYSIKTMGTYIMEELSPKVPGGLEWESWLRAHASQYPHTSRSLSYYAPYSLVFPVVAFVALVWVVPYIGFEQHLSSVTRSFMIGVWLLDFAISVISFYQIRKSAKDLLRRSSATPQAAAEQHPSTPPSA